MKAYDICRMQKNLYLNHIDNKMAILIWGFCGLDREYHLRCVVIDASVIALVIRGGVWFSEITFQVPETVCVYIYYCFGYGHAQR